MIDPEAHARADQLMNQIQMHHWELGEMVGEYRGLLAEVVGGEAPDQVALARALPGARYRVKSEYIRQTWLQVEVELRRMFPRED